MAHTPVDRLEFFIQSFNRFSGFIDNSLPGCAPACEQSEVAPVSSKQFWTR